MFHSIITPAHTWAMQSPACDALECYYYLPRPVARRIGRRAICTPNRVKIRQKRDFAYLRPFSTTRTCKYESGNLVTIRMTCVWGIIDLQDYDCSCSNSPHTTTPLSGIDSNVPSASYEWSIFCFTTPFVPWLILYWHHATTSGKNRSWISYICISEHKIMHK